MFCFFLGMLHEEAAAAGAPVVLAARVAGVHQPAARVVVDEVLCYTHCCRQAGNAT